jgi:hypothetical protein
MAIQYYMRAYNTATRLYVDWVVNDTPDSTGVYAPGGNANLTNIVANNSVQSKIYNFLKPVIEPSYIDGYYNNPQDGYLFHLNSYDWLNPVVIPGPITVPAADQPIGISVVRGASENYPPFTLTPLPYASLYWEEGFGEWSFAYINHDGTIGSALPVSMGILQVDGYLSVTDVSTDPVALTGLIRIPNNQFIKARNSANTGDANLIGLNAVTTNPSVNRVTVGDTTYPVYIPGPYLLVDNYIVNTTSDSNASASQSGFIRNPNASTIVTARNAANSADLILLSTTSGNLITVGDAVNSGIVYNTSTGNVHNFEVNGSSQVNIGASYVSFSSAVTVPLFSQITGAVSTGGTGTTLTVQAQNTTGTTTTGGGLTLTSGTGTSHSGALNLETGGLTQVAITGDTVASGVVTQLSPTRSFGINALAPIINQVTQITGNGQVLTVQAQNAMASGTAGGGLTLTSGTGTTTAGNVLIQTGGVTQLTITPLGATFAGNLTVLGTTTTIDSTVVDIEGRVIHGNFSPPTTLTTNPINPPGSITGYSINRGNTTGGGSTNTNRDSAALIYTEIVDLYTDGYWKHATVLHDVDTNLAYTGNPATQALVATLPVLASAVVATGNPNQELVTPVNYRAQMPSTGGFRSLNATPAVTSRNAASTQDLFLIGTNATNHIILGETPTPQNAGFQLYTTTGSLTDFFVNNVSEVQISSDTNGPFVRESAATFVPAQSGFVRVPNNGTAVAARNAGNTADILLVGTDTLNHILHGGSVSPTNGGQIFSTTTNSIFDFWVNGVSQVSIGANEINFTNTDGYATIQQSPTYLSGITGGSLSVLAQSVLGTNGIGGNLVLSSGFGSLIDGYIDLQVAGTTVAAVEPNKFTFVQGKRRHITQITGTYNVQLSDDYIAITALTSPFTIYLPAFGTPAGPYIGDSYEIKDTTGNTGTLSVTINGNGANIDGSSTFVFSQPYAAAIFTFTGTTWSIT